MGKTTTIRSLLGITQASSGRVRFSGQEVQQWPAYRISRLGIGLVPEGRQIFPLLTVRENLLATAANRHNLSSAWDLQKFMICSQFFRIGETNWASLSLGRATDAGDWPCFND